ncbi:WD repeat-containing protein 33 [Lobulomyces angularis]|nr:WD repeat-containing protein 33 [Lobulomyces angularis]
MQQPEQIQSDFKRGAGFGWRGSVKPDTQQDHAAQGESNFSTDGKRHRRAIQRKTVDYYSAVMRFLEVRTWKNFSSKRGFNALQPHQNFIAELLPSYCYNIDASMSITTKYVHTSTNKQRCPINCVKWTPDGRRLITASSSGEFTLWNGLTFNFETIQQAHEKAVRAMQWSHNENWMISADDSGVIKYWQSNMNNMKEIQGHKDIIRDLSFSPNDSKFASCSDDGTIKIWDFLDHQEERSLTGHGWDVKCIDWHPTKGLLASGSKDNLVKLWDPKTGSCLTTLHGHKNTISGLEFNKNGHHILTACRDSLLRIFDIRTMKEIECFKGHKKDVTSIKWHPFNENLFCSGGLDGSIKFWITG